MSEAGFVFSDIYPSGFVFRGSTRGCAPPSTCTAAGSYITSINYGSSKLVYNDTCCDSDNCNAPDPSPVQAPPAGSLRCYNCATSTCTGNLTCSVFETCSYTTVSHTSGRSSEKKELSDERLQQHQLIPKFIGINKVVSCCNTSHCNDPSVRNVPPTTTTQATPTNTTQAPPTNTAQAPPTNTTQPRPQTPLRPRPQRQLRPRPKHHSGPAHKHRSGPAHKHHSGPRPQTPLRPRPQTTTQAPLQCYSCFSLQSEVLFPPVQPGGSVEHLTSERELETGRPPGRLTDPSCRRRARQHLVQSKDRARTQTQTLLLLWRPSPVRLLRQRFALSPDSTTNTHTENSQAMGFDIVYGCLSEIQCNKTEVTCCHGNLCNALPTNTTLAPPTNTTLTPPTNSTLTMAPPTNTTQAPLQCHVCFSFDSACPV
ncbi:hypothetical protein WMY93_033175 [Mugilogobius chulae]|uniref:UPAR/Ly6 domain-containing protein n=1 Tax=Mugilogobius chulae TaxID=88201 RepID=A0AAW0MHU2_9GOBI